MYLILSLLLSLAPVAQAGELAGVTLPDNLTIGGTPVVLNGMGLREKYWIDVYVGGLYLPTKTTSDTKAIQDDVAKRIDMAFIYSKVTKEQMVETFEEGLAKQPETAAALKDRYDRLTGMMDTVLSGEHVVFDYIPGQGTHVIVKGVDRGTIEGVDFMRSLFTIYLGASPPTANLKSGMLGGK